MRPSQNYISDETTRFVGSDLKGQSDHQAKQYELLSRVLRTGIMKPGEDFLEEVVAQATTNPYGKLSNNDAYDLAYVCFCDIAVNDLGLHASKYSSFGLSFAKSFLIRKGANPVFYVAKGSGVPRPAFSNESSTGWSRRIDEFDRAWEAYQKLRGKIWDRRIDRQLATLLEHFMISLDFNVFTYVKVFDDSLPEQDAGNYYMEREWRTLGSTRFRLQDVHRVLLPHSYVDRFKADVANFPGHISTLN